ncbi:MAG: hypothetical protein KKC77_19605, partial [Proteobacteria bacterium]|nr:hypothetical protein [Pseudomonadota bacterium]
MEETKITPEQQAFNEAGEFIDKYYQAYSSVLTPYKKNIKEWNKDYNCIPTKRTYGLANTFVPESFIAIETVVADLVSLILGYDPPFIGAEVPEEYMEHKKLMERLMWQLMLDGEFKRKTIRYIRGLSIDGIKPCYAFFNEEKKTVKDKLRGEDGKFTIKEVEKTVKMFPDFESPDIIDTFFDPMTHELKGCLLQWKVDWPKIKGLAKQGRIKEDLLDSIKDAAVSTGADNEKQIKDAKFQEMGFEKTKSVETEYLLRVFFGDIPAWWIKPELKDEESGKDMVTGEV